MLLLKMLTSDWTGCKKGNWLAWCAANFQRKEEGIGAQVVCEAGVGGSWAQAESPKARGNTGS